MKLCSISAACTSLPDNHLPRINPSKVQLCLVISIPAQQHTCRSWISSSTSPLAARTRQSCRRPRVAALCCCRRLAPMEQGALKWRKFKG